MMPTETKRAKVMVRKISARGFPYANVQVRYYFSRASEGGRGGRVNESARKDETNGQRSEKKGREKEKRATGSEMGKRRASEEKETGRVARRRRAAGRRRRRKVFEERSNLESFCSMTFRDNKLSLPHYPQMRL